MWPFSTKQFSAYLGTHGLSTIPHLTAEQIEQLTTSIRTRGQLPSPFNKHKTTLRLAPSAGRCYTLQATHNRLGQAELKGLAAHWGKTLMGPQCSTWQWQAVQIEIEQPILLCACKVDAQHLNAFQTVKPELLYQIEQIEALKKNSSAWLVCSDEYLVQSALVLNGQTVSIRTWPPDYTTHVHDVIEKHLLLSDATHTIKIDHIVESRLGEVKIHGSL